MAGYNLLVMQIKDLGEFAVIELLKETVTAQRSGPNHGTEFGYRLLVDNGDDAAAWRTGEATELFTTDTMVEGVHFNRSTTPWTDLGWKSLASNISDIAAMGGLPMYALVTLGLPPETDVDHLKELYAGMMQISNTYGVAIVGGDLVRSPVVFITVSLTGVHPGNPMLRTAARAGDGIGVTGYLGSSGAGLRLLLEDTPAETPAETPAPSAAAEYSKESHRRPHPAVEQGRLLSKSGVETAMDISDGLADDLSKLCQASGLSARIYADRVPVHPLVKQTYPDNWLDLALNGGEDYQLLFTARSRLMSEVLPLLPEGSALIGEITDGRPGEVVIVGTDGQETAAAPGGWDHYR